MFRRVIPGSPSPSSLITILLIVQPLHSSRKPILFAFGHCCSITGVFYQEPSSLLPFKHTLRQSDQLVFDDLFANVHKHLAVSAYAAHPLPLEIFMLAMILEEHKEVMRIQLYVDNKSVENKHNASK